jgi:hypothetical protein
MFIAGACDWGTYQVPGAFECMQGICTNMAGCYLIEQAGHWAQQEWPDDVVALISRLLNET